MGKRSIFITAGRAGKGLFRHRLTDFERRYREFLYSHYSNMNTKGLSPGRIQALKLEPVVPDLCVEPSSINQFPTSPFCVLPNELKTGKHSIWKFLSAAQPDHGQRLVITGLQASGKSTLLQQVTLELCRNGNQPFARKEWLPVLIPLDEYAGEINSKNGESLPVFIEMVLTDLGLTVPPGWFERHLSTGRCLVMFDCLDKVSNSVRRRVAVDWLEQQMSQYSRCDFIIASRPSGYYANQMNEVNVLQIAPFDVNEIQHFAYNWFAVQGSAADQKTSPLLQRQAQHDTVAFLRQLLHPPVLMDLATNPLLLVLIARIYIEHGALPDRPVELFKRLCAELLDDRHRPIMQLLAYRMMLAKKREIHCYEPSQWIADALWALDPTVKPDAFLQDVEQNGGLLFECESGLYRFAHPALQDYLAATYCVENESDSSLAQWIDDPWWAETIHLYASQADSTALVEACLAKQPPTDLTIGMALGCAEEALRLDDATRQKLADRLQEDLESTDPERFRAAAGGLLEKRIRNMTRLTQTTWIDTSLVTCAEYQLFLDEKLALQKFYQPDHWKDTRFAPGQASSPVLGVRPSDVDAFCEWLSRRYGGNFRAPKGAEITTLKNSIPGFWSIDGPAGMIYHGELPETGPHASEWIQATIPTELHGTRGIDAAFNRALNLDLDLDLVRALDLNLAEGRGLPNLRENALAFSLSHDTGLAQAFVSSNKLSRAIEHIIELATDLDLARARALTVDRSRECDILNARDLGISYALTHSLAIAKDLNVARAHDPGMGLAFDLVWLYAKDMLILVLRRMGFLPAFEGILIAREL